MTNAVLEGILKKIAPRITGRDFFETTNRGERIRTSGLLRPRQARYQAALRPDKQEVHCASFDSLLQ